MQKKKSVKKYDTLKEKKGTKTSLSFYFITIYTYSL